MDVASKCNDFYFENFLAFVFSFEFRFGKKKNEEKSISNSFFPPKIHTQNQKKKNANFYRFFYLCLAATSTSRR